MGQVPRDSGPHAGADPIRRFRPRRCARRYARPRALPGAAAGSRRTRPASSEALQRVQGPAACLASLLFSCSPRAQIQARRPEEHSPQAFFSTRLPWWAKEVSNLRPPACKERPEASSSYWILQNAFCCQGVMSFAFQLTQARFGLFWTIMFAIVCQKSRRGRERSSDQNPLPKRPCAFIVDAATG
jgi:hypothetical protein